MRKASGLVMFIALIGALPPVHAAETVTYSYDHLGRLTKVVRSGGPASGAIVDITHDAMANRIRLVSTIGQTSPSGNCGFRVLDAAGNGEYTFEVPVQRVGTCTGTVVINYNNGFGGTGQLSFIPSEEYKYFPVPASGCGSGNSTATITVASGDAFIDRGAATVMVWESC
ncbi:hypothetical protein [Sphingomonas sp. GB1N7]|uniref:hypothetical protein n=1 Tax=Parasphingomonas caseinilytica TaxID=3096158 RepID=UPI002FC92EC8